MNYQATKTSEMLGGAKNRSDVKAKDPFVWVVVLNYNRPQVTINCVESLLGLRYTNFNVVVVDNGSTDESVARFEETLIDPRIQLVLNDKNDGYPGGNNLGIEKALSEGAKYVFILNNDTVVEQGCLASLVKAMEEDPELGIVGCPVSDIHLNTPTEAYWHVNLFTMRTAGAPEGWDVELDESSFISGAAFLMRADAAKQIGMFDSRFFLDWEDLDLSFRARRAGYKLKAISGPGVRHIGSHTAKRYSPLRVFCYFRNRAWIVRRHGRLRHRILFNLYNVFYFYPRIIAGRVRHGESHLLLPVLRGIWNGHTAYPGPYPDLAG